MTYSPIQGLISPFLTIISLPFSSPTIPSSHTYHIIQPTSYFPQTSPKQPHQHPCHPTCATTTTSFSANVAASTISPQIDAPPNATVCHNMPQSSSYVWLRPPISSKTLNAGRKPSTMMEERYVSFTRGRKERRRKRLGRW
jgi:hypothetical protein